jgi:hypothetical protein
MNGYRGVQAKLLTFATLDYENMTKSMHSLARQITVGKTSHAKSKWDLACRAWRAFTPKTADYEKVVIRDLTVPLREMSDVVQQYAIAHGATETNAPFTDVADLISPVMQAPKGPAYEPRPAA